MDSDMNSDDEATRTNSFNYFWPLVLAAALTVSGCSESGGEETPAESSSPQPMVAAKKGGSITVGQQTWTIIASIQCSVYGENMLNIAGHAQEDESLEIVIDLGGPDQVRIVEGRDALWHAVRSSITMQVEGKRVRGTADFTKSINGGGEAVPGKWEVDC